MYKYPSHIAILVVLLLLINPWTADIWGHFLREHWGIASYKLDQAITLHSIIDAWIGFSILMMGLRKQSMGILFRESGALLTWSSLCMILIMLTVNPIYAGKLQWLRLIFPAGSLYLATKSFYLAFVKPSPGPWQLRLRPWATTAFALIAFLLVLEGVFLFVGKSTLNDNSLASKVWFSRHWALTSKGFRESPGLSQPDTSKPQLVFIGDSFLAGHGIADPADRFSDCIQAKLGDRWQVHNHGQNGADTYREMSQIGVHPYNPKLVVLCWFLNDIHTDAESVGLHTGNEGTQPPFPISLVHGSYLINYLAGLFPAQQAGDNYLRFLQSAFGNANVLRQHANTLEMITTECKHWNYRFAVVLFPMMNLVEGSEFALQPMRDYWQTQGVPCLDLAPIFKPYTADELTVNASDAHPSRLAHQLAGDAIFAFLKKNQLLLD